MTIGALAGAVGVSVDTVRFYERRGLLPPPPRTDAGYRTYGEADEWRLTFILRAKSMGFTLREIVGLLEHTAAPTSDAAAAVRSAAVAKLEAIAVQRRSLEDVADRLAELLRRCDDGEDDDCATLKLPCEA